MFNISKTTFNMAMRRGVELAVARHILEDGGTLVCFYEADNDCEWMFSYRAGEAELTWHGNIYLPESIKEELPATIFNEKQLRDVIAYIGRQLPLN
jgi:hypothetical protein